jgi:dihydrofolate synthase/folylpolyglutamate synthase
VITNIGLNTQFLGNALATIAEKAGIIKPNIPVVIGEYTQTQSLFFWQKPKKLIQVFCF